MLGLRDICDEVISKAFPELLNLEVRVDYRGIEDGLAECDILYGGGFYVDLDPVLGDQSVDVVQGALAHELAHIVLGARRRVRLTMFERFIDWIACKISPRFQSLHERNVDLEVIMRGYGRQLMALMEYSEEEWGFDPSEGLSRREIRAILSAGEVVAK